MTKEEAKGIINKIRYEYTFNCNKNSLKVIKAFNMAIEALSTNTKTIYCWECKYQHECVQSMAIEGKNEIIHSCSYGEKTNDEEIK